LDFDETRVKQSVPNYGTTRNEEPSFTAEFSSSQMDSGIAFTVIVDHSARGKKLSR
jgi:hypothetical protein